jgi:hypothetical protein
MKRDEVKEIPKPSDKDFASEAVDRFEESSTHQSQLREKAISDYKFALIPGHQWDQHLSGKRRKRPCYEFNRQRQMIRRVTGQQLQNRPQIKVRPSEDGDVETAEILSGMIRNIEASSNAKTAYDNAFTWACAGGVGAWEITTDYENNNGFDKCLHIERIEDPFSVTYDSAARDFYRRDARFCFLSKIIPRSTFKRLYPGKKIVDFTANSGKADANWWYQDTVRIAKYYYKENEKRVIYQLNDGTIVDAVEFDPIAPEAEKSGITIAQTREIDLDIVKCCLISGAERLTEPVEWPGQYIPVVLNWGELHVVDGQEYYSGMTRHGRDAQMIHNFELSTLIEVIAKMPNSPLTATPKMIEGLHSYYERLGYDDPPVLLYNVDPTSPNARPTREPAAQFPSAFATMSSISIDEIKATMGVYDASMGAQGNETSGRAILARQQEADISNYVYVDNHLKALEYTGMILVDSIPKVYDATRTIRILGEDSAEKFVRVNVRVPVTDKARQAMASGKLNEEMIVALIKSGDIKVINDLSRGKYDVVVSTGKSFETMRMETAEVAEALSRSPGPLGMIGQYLLIKSIDAPGMDEMIKAIRKILVSQGMLEPGESDEPPQPQQPNPKDVADAELKVAQARKADAQTQQILAETPALVEKTRAETAQTVTGIAERLPTVPIGPSVFGPDPSAPPESPSFTQP